MSRIGMRPVALPQGVKVIIKDGVFSVEGPKGKLEQSFVREVEFKVGPSEVVVSRLNETNQARAYHGLYRNLLNNMVLGVSAGFTRSLIVNGVGYKSEVKGDILVMSLGYSTDFAVLIPKDLKVAVEPNGKITVSGIDKQKVGKFASEIRSLRLPEPYKGKGIRYEEEKIRRKVGKSGVKAG
jgi:large subunit ribosomal protein L6